LSSSVKFVDFGVPGWPRGPAAATPAGRARCQSKSDREAPILVTAPVPSLSKLRGAGLPSARIEGIRNGTFTSWTADEYSSRFTGKPAADEAARKRTIDTVDVSGDAAMVRATLVHGPTTFTDYFVLLESGGEWKIANKVYSSRPTK
jgi:hypothetical protein